MTKIGYNNLNEVVLNTIKNSHSAVIPKIRELIIGLCANNESNNTSHIESLIDKVSHLRAVSYLTHNEMDTLVNALELLHADSVSLSEEMMREDYLIGQVEDIESTEIE